MDEKILEELKKLAGNKYTVLQHYRAYSNGRFDQEYSAYREDCGWTSRYDTPEKTLAGLAERLDVVKNPSAAHLKSASPSPDEDSSS